MKRTNPIFSTRPLLQVLACFGFLFLLTISFPALAQENCFNGIDDDGDGLIDLNDDECICQGFGGTTNQSSLIPNSSFEERTCCPQGYSSSGSSDYLNNCANNWIQASTPTSDYWHTCGAAGSSADGGASLPPPDGQGFIGFINMSGWQEYVGTCLLQTMTAGTTYDLTFYMGYSNNSPSLDLTFYGTPNCGDLPFSGNDCPLGQGGWVQLGQTTVGGPMGWEPITVTFTPTVDVSAIVLGGSCGSGGGRTYYYMDDLSLVSTQNFEVLSITQSGQYCDDNIVLTAMADTSGGTWQWYKEGIAIVGQTNNSYPVPSGLTGVGNYTVTYTIGSQCESINSTVVEPDLPAADFTTANVCFPEDVSFTDQSTVASGAITSWNWDFGDGNTSTQQHPVHAYASDGVYSVELTVTTDINCVAVFQRSVTVYPKPTVAFTSVPGCLGDPTVFTDMTQINAPGTIASYQWSFGDGNTSAQSDPSNFYAVENAYDVKLIVTSGDGCIDSSTAIINVYPSPQVAVSAEAECARDDVQFVNGSSISSGSITHYDWDFGDNSTSSTPAPIHVYTAPGTYTVTLSAISNRGCISDTTFQLISYPNPVADFTATEVCAGHPIQLEDNSSVITPGILTTWEVDMGDNSPVQNALPTEYEYATAGAYTIELVLTTQHGCTDMQQVQTHVHAIPVADFSFTDICEDDSVRFVDQSTIASGAITGWQWNFGNGNMSSLQAAPFQVYPADAVYPVSLIVNSAAGCADTLANSIEVFPVPIANFTFDSVCFPLNVQFTDLSAANGAYDLATWQWQFSDGQISSIQNPNIDFGMPGEFAAQLKITNAPGCKNAITKGNAVVHPLPVAQFPTDLATCLNDTIFLTDQSTLIPITDDVIDQWQWTLDDGSVSTSQNDLHIYQNPALYNVNLRVGTNHACTDEVTHMVEVFPLPFVDFSASPSEGCQPLQVQFFDQSSIPSPYNLRSWQWNLGTDSSTASSSSPTFLYDPIIDPLSIQQYDISLVVTSANGCSSSVSRPDYITVFPKPDALFSVDKKVKDLIKPEFIFTDLSSKNVTLWDWTFGDGSSATDQHPVHLYSDTGSYRIVQIVETQYGCLDTAEYKVKVEPIFTFYIPNSFTPDDDGINDAFYGQGEGYTTYNMHIYDRWGEHIFESNSDQYHWDGTYKGKQVQQGTFVYYFYLLDWKGHDHEYRGHVTLHR